LTNEETTQQEEQPEEPAPQEPPATPEDAKQQEDIQEPAPPEAAATVEAVEQEEQPKEPAPHEAPATTEAAPARPERRRRGRPGGRRKVCAFCVDQVDIIDYKDPVKLRRYLSDRGKIEPRRKTGTCAKHQRRLSVALKRARHLALLPYTADHIRLTGIFAPRS
jgi:small subunit ribosomal protein S18